MTETETVTMTMWLLLLQLQTQTQTQLNVKWFFCDVKFISLDFAVAGWYLVPRSSDPATPLKLFLVMQANRPIRHLLFYILRHERGPKFNIHDSVSIHWLTETDRYILNLKFQQPSSI